MADVDTAFHMNAGFQLSDGGYDNDGPEFGLRPLPAAANLRAPAGGQAANRIRFLPFSPSSVITDTRGSFYLEPGTVPADVFPVNGSGYIVMDEAGSAVHMADLTAAVGNVIARPQIVHIGGGPKNINVCRASGTFTVIVNSTALENFLKGKNLPLAVSAATMDDDAEIGYINGGARGHLVSRAAFVVAENGAGGVNDATIRILGVKTVCGTTRDMTELTVSATL